MRRVHPTSARAGMTLIELLIVMLIIVTLASLVLAAVFAVRSAQEKNFTEALVQKLDTALAQQWKAATDQIREEPVPNWALTMASGNPQIAKVIYLKARLKQEFPVSFYQAIVPNGNFKPGQPGAYMTPGMSFADLPAKSAYAKALGPLSGSAAIPNPATLPIPEPEQYFTLTDPTMAGFEASALLYLAVSQGRRGLTAFNPEEHVEPTAIRTATVTSVNNGAPVSVTLKYFVDSWGYPVRYWAFPFGNDELNASPYRDVAFAQNQQSPDPQDPERAFLTFLPPSYPWSINPSVPTSPTFARMVHSPVYPNPATKANDLRLLMPVVGSQGRDGSWGLLPTAAAGSGPGGYFDMTIDPTSSGSDDNIYSYRLRRVGRRGD